MDLRNLNTFIQVAETGSFTRAAELLGYSQPSISIQIKQLEQELGIRLFERIGHTVRLTDRGRDALVYAQRIWNLSGEMSRESRKGREPEGLIRLATADSLCGPLVRRGFAHFQEQYPGIRVKILTGGTADMFRMLDHNEADLVCTLDSHIYNANYVIASEEKVGVHFVAAPSHPLAGCENLSLRALADQPFVMTEKGMSYRRLLDELLACHSLELHPVLELGHTDILCDLAAQGIGLSFLPDYVTQEAVAQGRLVRLSVEGFQPELWKQLLYHRDKWLSPPMELVLRYLSSLSIP